MLTRCRAGLVVVTSKAFIKSRGGVHTLLGDLARHWQQHHEGQTDVWVDWKLVADGTANLPGSPGPKPRAQQYAAPPVNGYSDASSRVHVPPSYKGPTGGFDVSSLFRRCPPPCNNRSVPIETPIKSTYAAVAEVSQTDWSRLSLWSAAPSFSSVSQKRPQYYYPEVQQTPDPFSYNAFPPLIVSNHKQGAPRYLGQDQNRFSLLKAKASPPKNNNKKKSKPVPAVRPTQSFTHSQARTEDFIPRSEFQPNPASQANVLEGGWTRVERRRGFGRRAFTYAEAAQLPYRSY
jgi:hypothetical protein